MTEYETVEGTQPHPYVKHEPRIIERREGADLMMMTEIGDGVFIQWADCRRCSERVASCKCQGGPVGPDWMKRYQDQRFERELATRPDPDYDLLPSVLKWVEERGYRIVRPDATAALDPDEDAEESPVRVRFQPQAWVNDNAMDVDAEGPTEWYVSRETAEEIPDSSDLDFVRGDDFAPKWVADWSGPFEITVIEPDIDDERDREETGPVGDARTYEPETGEKIEPALETEGDRLKGRQFDAGF